MLPPCSAVGGVPEVLKVVDEILSGGAGVVEGELGDDGLDNGLGAINECAAPICEAESSLYRRQTCSQSMNLSVRRK